MQIDLPATLHAVYNQYDENYDEIEGPGRVIVMFGNKVVTELVATGRPSQHYDTAMNEVAENNIAEETVALWLREKLA